MPESNRNISTQQFTDSPSAVDAHHDGVDAPAAGEGHSLVDGF